MIFWTFLELTLLLFSPVYQRLFYFCLDNKHCLHTLNEIEEVLYDHKADMHVIGYHNVVDMLFC